MINLNGDIILIKFNTTGNNVDDSKILNMRELINLP